MSIHMSRAGFLARLSILCLISGCGDNLKDPADAAPTFETMPPIDAAPFQECGDRLITGTEECDDGNDSDDDECLSTCLLACGDGVVNPIETCDVGIPSGEGACPTQCDDADACTTNVLDGDGCRSACVFTQITARIDDDGCCPVGADSLSDSDCTGICGNGVIEAGETCDTAIAAGQPGACPAMSDCVDNVACTSDLLVNGGSCTAVCDNSEITMPQDGDGCCPAGATSADDDDCSAMCGDGKVSPELGETCDTAITPGSPDACPTLAECVDGVSCTLDELLSAGTCNAVCNHPPVIMIGLPDGCCPAGGNANTDPDCTASCGNGSVEQGETCDDGNTTSGDGCSATCVVEVVPAAYRMVTLHFRDPHAITSLVNLCTDITPNLNLLLGNSITMDQDGDGFFDLSVVSLFRPLDQAAMTTPMELRLPSCAATATGTSCAPAPGETPVTGLATNLAAGTCLAPVPGTVRPYNPPVFNAIGPCYSSAPQTITLDIGGIQVTLTDARVGATYNGNPATNLVNGLLIGFISEADADATIIPNTIPIVGGHPLSSLLPGGTGNCSTTNDKDIGPGGVMGWWMYLNFTAERVMWTGP